MSDNTNINQTNENAVNTLAANAENLNIKDKLMASGVVATTGAAVYGTYTIFDTNHETSNIEVMPPQEPTSEVSTMTEDDCDENIIFESTTQEDQVEFFPEVENDIPFVDAFRDARKSLGDNATFEWRGGHYTTNYMQDDNNEASLFDYSSQESNEIITDNHQETRSEDTNLDVTPKAINQDESVQQNDLPDLFENSNNAPATSDSNMAFGKLDSNGDGKWDTLVIDKNNDGKVDLMATDDDHDGRFDMFMVNDNNDFTIDRSIFDTNHNGVDANDTIENVSYEIDMLDYEHVNEEEAGFDQFDILGGLL
jgi:hypothetical protein